MQLLYTTSNFAFAQLIRFTFDREGIRYHYSDADARLAGPLDPHNLRGYRFYLLDEEDAEQAVELLRSIDAFGTAKPDAESARVTRAPVSGPMPLWLSMLIGLTIVGVITALLSSR